MRTFFEGTIRSAKLDVLIMPNDEILCGGKHIGWLKEKLPGSFSKEEITFKNYLEEEK